MKAERITDETCNISFTTHTHGPSDMVCLKKTVNHNKVFSILWKRCSALKKDTSNLWANYMIPSNSYFYLQRIDNIVWSEHHLTSFVYATIRFLLKFFSLRFNRYNIQILEKAGSVARLLPCKPMLLGYWFKIFERKYFFLLNWISLDNFILALSRQLCVLDTQSSLNQVLNQLIKSSDLSSFWMID